MRDVPDEPLLEFMKFHAIGDLIIGRVMMHHPTGQYGPSVTLSPVIIRRVEGKMKTWSACAEMGLGLKAGMPQKAFVASPVGTVIMVSYVKDENVGKASPMKRYKYSILDPADVEEVVGKLPAGEQRWVRKQFASLSTSSTSESSVGDAAEEEVDDDLPF